MTGKQIGEKYGRSYFVPQEMTCDWVKKEYVDKAPLWCSVDLRDGNQALVEPMNLEEKLEFFRMLVLIGFKEIEVGFPAASDTEYNFIRALIERDMIPQDVIQREQVFKKDREEIKKLAVDGARLLSELAAQDGGDIRFEYSPESFSQTEVEYASEVCNAVLDVWQPTVGHKAIINLPSTVQVAMPHIFAGQIEYMHKHMKYRDAVVLSVHPHNDRGTGICDAEFGVLAGADRVEGTLFGNGERTGNVDVVTLAMNLVCHGVNPELDFSDLPAIREKYERLTGMQVQERTPYAGALVFTAFSGSHQDAISKGMAWREEHPGEWAVPYLPIDPKDVGREYESDVIRINSQSGKGGIAFILKQNFGISLPDKMKDEVRILVKAASDKGHKELAAEEIYQIFTDTYISPRPVFDIPECHFKQTGGITAEVTISCGGEVITASGNGRLDAVSNALKGHFGLEYRLTEYEERAVSSGSSSKAAAFVGIVCGSETYWGVGIDEDIIKSSVAALVVAANKAAAKKNGE